MYSSNKMIVVWLFITLYLLVFITDNILEVEKFLIVLRELEFEWKNAHFNFPRAGQLHYYFLLASS